MEPMTVSLRALKKISISCIFIFIFTYQAFAGWLRVAQMGTGWLVPDAATDIVFNPARINNLDKGFLGIKLGTYNQTDGITPEYDYTNTVPEICFIKKADPLAFGFYLGPVMTLIGGLKAGENLSLGLNINATSEDLITAYDYYYYPPHLAVIGTAMGVEYIFENQTYGVKLEYKSAYNSLERYVLVATLLFEMKTGLNGMFRALNTVSYSAKEYGIDLTDIPEYINFGYFGRLYGKNKTGVSYSGSFAGVNYFLSALNEWNFIDHYSYASGYYSGAVYHRYEVNKDSDTFVLTLGCETPLFVDWMKFRLGYELFRAEYGYEIIRENSSTSGETFDYNRAYMVKVIPSPNSTTIRLGLGFKIGDSMDLDLKFGSDNVYALDNTEGDATNWYYGWDFYNFNAEFIWKF